jgi:hypothetical protein
MRARRRVDGKQRNLNQTKQIKRNQINAKAISLSQALARTKTNLFILPLVHRQRLHAQKRPRFVAQFRFFHIHAL